MLGKTGATIYGVNTTLFEQFPLPHTRGSSHGLSRAFRFLGELELGRLEYSLDRWKALENATHETMLIKTGLLNFGLSGDPDLAKYMAVLSDAGRPFEWLGSAAIKARFPLLNYPEEWGAAWDPNGAILIAHRCLCAVQTRFLALGGQIVTGQVESVQSRGEDDVFIEVRSNMTRRTERLTFDRTVISAGPWTSKIVPQLGGLLSSRLTPVTYWRDTSGSCRAADGFPILFNARLTDIYGIPSCEYPGLFKMLFHGGPEADPDTRDQVSFKPYVNKVSRYVQEYLPFLDYRNPAIQETCMYTMTPDSFPIIDRIARNVVVGCGFSGSGFKHSPATGRMLAALALGQEDTVPEEFRADRYLLGRFQIDEL